MPMVESPGNDHEARRLRVRSWRRGTREMDLILGPYADAMLAGMGRAERDAYAALLEESDPALYAWVAETEAAPDRHRPVLARIRRFHRLEQNEGGEDG